jgi:hypothetical protein
MSIQSELVTIFTSLFQGNRVMSGGGTANKLGSFFYLLMIFLILLLVKSYIVQVAYNHVVPVLIYSMDVKRSMKYEEVRENFRPIRYVEAILVVILFNMLFSKI